MIRTTKLVPFVISALLLVMLAAACGAPATTPAPTEVPPSPTALQMPTAEPATAAPTTAAAAPTTNTATGEVSGASLYEVSCAACHGADLKGTTFDKDGKKIDVPALTWGDLSATFQTQPSRGTAQQQLALAITKGQDETGADLNTMMPRWSALSQAQVDSLVQYLQTASTASGAAPTLEPAATNLMGGALYKAACGACHGDDGAGLTFDKDGQKIDVPALTWDSLSQTFQTQPARGTAQQQLALAITKGQDETGADLNTMMPRWSALSQAQVDSLIQYFQAGFK